MSPVSVQVLPVSRLSLPVLLPVRFLSSVLPACRNRCSVLPVSVRPVYGFPPGASVYCSADDKPQQISSLPVLPAHYFLPQPELPALWNSPDSDSMYLFPLFSFLNPFQTHSRSLPPNHVTVHSHFSPVYRNWILPMLHIPNRQNASTVPRKNSDRSPPGTLSSAFPGCGRVLPCFRTQSTGLYSKYTCW